MSKAGGNLLGGETSPYLLQHAGNPVAWMPWGEAALERAVREDKPILLSIGYAACHWCHVMAHECFEDAEIAGVMNAEFVCVKVDREERPDLDDIYQHAHHILTQRPGGWPLTMALTPQGQAPFFAGTYFPPKAGFGRPGFGEVLGRVAAHYREHREGLREHHVAFARTLAELNPKAVGKEGKGGEEELPAFGEVLERAAGELAGRFDGEFGGFGGAPKFPHPTQLELLLWRGWGVGGKGGRREESRRMLGVTLRRMAEGGLFDQLGGGFFRYTVDGEWQIPHFEKMLYDNAQLLGLYGDAYRYAGAGGEGELYGAVVRETAGWVMREMQAEGGASAGGYAATLDADSEGVEGKFYVWSETDLRALLTAEEFARVEDFYGLAGEANFEGRWHLTVKGGRGGLDAGGRAVLERARGRLLAARGERVRPGLDDKVLTGWNGLMIRGMARAAMGFLGRGEGGEEVMGWVESAGRAVDFIRAELWRGGRLRVTSRGGVARLNGYLDDYAFVAEGLVELLQVRWRGVDLEFAVALCDCLLEHFEDGEGGGFFFTSHDHEKLLHRAKPGVDGAIPSGNAAAIRVLFRLGFLLGRRDYLESAERGLRVFAGAWAGGAVSVYGALGLAVGAGEGGRVFVVRGWDGEALEGWRGDCLRGLGLGEMVFAVPGGEDLPEGLARREVPPRGSGRTVAYVCRGLECGLPIETREGLREELGLRGG